MAMMMIWVLVRREVVVFLARVTIGCGECSWRYLAEVPNMGMMLVPPFIFKGRCCCLVPQEFFCSALSCRDRGRSVSFRGVFVWTWACGEC